MRRIRASTGPMTPVVTMMPSALLRTQSDERLLALSKTGHERAFEALVQRYRRALLRSCRGLVSEARAEDVVQQSFLSAWLALQEGTEVRDVRSWLYRIVHNAAVNACKRRGYDHEELREDLRGGDAPEQEIERRLAAREALTQIAALPPMQRQALMGVAVDGDSQHDVARALGVSDTVIRGLVYRARTTLRGALTGLTPAPLATWAASFRVGPVAPRIVELVGAGGGSAGFAAAIVKGGAVVAAAGAIATGAGVAPTLREEATEATRPGTAQAAPAQGPGSDSSAVVPAPGREDRGSADRHGGSGSGDDNGRHRNRDRGRHGSGDDDGAETEDHSGSSGSSGSGSSGQRLVREQRVVGRQPQRLVRQRLLARRPERLVWQRQQRLVGQQRQRLVRQRQRLVWH